MTIFTTGMSGPEAVDRLNQLVADLGAKADASALEAKQPLDTELTAIAGLVSAADKVPYFTGAGTAALADLTAQGRALIAGSDAAAQRVTMGLANVEDKSSAMIRSEITGGNVATALGFTPADAAQIGQAGGIAPLGSDSKVPATYLPSYVDDVVEAANFAALPITGESGKIYITIDDNKTYRWSGSAYVNITASPGSTDAVPEGASNLYFTAQRVRDAVLTGLSTATNAVISATDTVLSALGKLQKQISDNLAALNDKANTADLKPVAFSGAYADLTGVPAAGSSKLSALLAADAANTIDNGEFGQTWRWSFAGSVAGRYGLKVTENVASTATGAALSKPYLLAVETLAGSTINPFRVNVGTNSIIRVASSGSLFLNSVGTLSCSASTAVPASGSANGAGISYGAGQGTAEASVVGTVDNVHGGSIFFNAGGALAGASNVNGKGGSISFTPGDSQYGFGGDLKLIGGSAVSSNNSGKVLLQTRPGVAGTSYGAVIVQKGDGTADYVVVKDDGETALNGSVTLVGSTVNDGSGAKLQVTGAVRASYYLGIGKPQNSQSADYTAVALDSGKHLLHPSADTAARTFTIPDNTTVPYAIGTELHFVNQDSAGALTIAITTDTMRLAGSGATGSRTLATNGIATALKVTATEWIIHGTNLT